MTIEHRFGRHVGAVFGLVAALSFPLTMAGAWAQDADRARYLYDHPHMWGGWGGSGMFFGPLMGILYLAVIIGVIVVGVRWLGGGSWPGTGRGAARHILEERFARGEIDAEELEEKRRILSG